MTLRRIEYNSAEYEAMVALRMEVLRKLLGLTFPVEYLKKEASDLLLGAFINDRLAGCCILTKIDKTTVQLRQMAVATAEQGTGIGTALLLFAEETAIAHHFETLLLHARKVATGFYKKCGYLIEGNEYTEVGLPHYTMKKQLA